MSFVEAIASAMDCSSKASYLWLQMCVTDVVTDVVTDGLLEQSLVLS